MRSFSKKVGIVVDGFSTGKHIASALKSRGYDCIHVLSDTNHPKRGQVHTDHYVETIIYTNMDEILFKLKIRQVLFCVPGDESGVILADQLNDALALPTSNGTEYTLAKRNKYLMNEVAKKAGLPVVKHYKGANLEDLISWIETIKSWPIVLKPLDSASGDGVYVCKNSEEVTEKFHKIIGCVNKFGKQNQEVLAEEFNPGTEYIVNTVSCRGRHHVVEIWKMNKLPNTIIHDTCEFIGRNTHSELFYKIENYCFKLLNAFSMKFGACTVELKCFEDREPVLIEIGARLMGDAELSLTYDLLGYNQLSLMLDAYLSPNSFEKIASQSPINTTHALAVLLISSVQGRITHELTIVQYLMSLAALHSYQLPIIGDEITITRNITTCPGIIYLKDNDEKAIEEAYAKIREFEHAGLYNEAVREMNRPVPLSLLFSEVHQVPVESDEVKQSQNKNENFCFSCAIV